jgi:hypothetical protein
VSGESRGAKLESASRQIPLGLDRQLTLPAVLVCLHLLFGRSDADRAPAFRWAFRQIAHPASRLIKIRMILDRRRPKIVGQSAVLERFWDSQLGGASHLR